MAETIFVINPGSTSTKVGLFRGDEIVFQANVEHSAAELKSFGSISDQLPYRRDTILNQLAERGITLDDVDAFVGRGGGLLPVEGGVYAIGPTLIDHARRGANGVQHPAQLGSQLADELAKRHHKPAYVVNPPDTDEFCDLARMTGIKGVYRRCHLHALNLKETALRHAATIGRRYEDCNFIVCHIGGGISISAHEKGRMIDGNDIVGGDGPLTPTRCGSIPVAELLDYLKDHDVKSARDLCTKSGGFVSLLGTADLKEVTAVRIPTGDAAAARAWDAMIYQIVKHIGMMSTVLKGQVDGILLGGGLVHNADLVQKIEVACSWIAPVSAYPGEFELEAMAAGAIRVLGGVETAREYTGVPRWNGFPD
ncbi:MAG TPA: butyrate kinase [Anaerolineales bacterium]|nr:butyrate kinase [Anaerolineales bacterium]